MNYLKQKATPWVSISVLAGGLFTAVVLLWLVRIEAELRVTITSV
ncbi:MAG: hypothetical protein AAB719_00025 [Patescibacteria group bacterium]